MDLSEGFDAGGQTCSATEENVQEDILAAALSLHSSVTLPPASSEPTSQLGMIPIAFDYTDETSDPHLTSTGELDDGLIRYVTVSDSQPSEAESCNAADQPELVLKPAETVAECDDEESCQFSAALVDDDSRISVPLSTEQSDVQGDSGLMEETTDPESAGVQENAEESGRLTQQCVEDKSVSVQDSAEESNGSMPQTAEYESSGIQENANGSSRLMQETEEDELAEMQDSAEESNRYMQQIVELESTGVQENEEESSKLMKQCVEDEPVQDSMEERNKLMEQTMADELVGMQDNAEETSRLVEQTAEDESTGLQENAQESTRLLQQCVEDDEVVSVQDGAEQSNRLMQQIVEYGSSGVQGNVDQSSSLMQQCVENEPVSVQDGLEESNGLLPQAVEYESSGVGDTAEDSQQLSVDLGSRSQSPMSFVVQLNDDSECSLQSLPPGEHGPTNFGMKLGSLVQSYPTNVSAVYLEEDSQLSGRATDEPDLMMEVETGSVASEALSSKEGSTTLDAKTASTTSRKSSSRTEDRNKSRIRKRLMVETTAVETENGFVTYIHTYI